MYEKPTPVTEEAMAASYAVPTAVVDRFLVSTAGGVPGKVRIAFGESMGSSGVISYRIAVQMTPVEAHELKSILESLLQPFQGEIDAVIKGAGDGGQVKG